MKKAEVQELVVLIGQIKGHHNEFTALSKSKAKDCLNTFKLKIINESLDRCNKLLGTEYKPFKEFELFDTVDMPTNSDVVLILNQYSEALERLRGDNVEYKSGSYQFKLSDSNEEIRSLPPRRV